MNFKGVAWWMGPTPDRGPGVIAPVADFEADVTALQEPTSMTVEFTDLSTNDPTSWLWDFGDSTTSTDQNPTKVYTAAGVYTVSLTATNAGGDSTETKVGYITVTAWYRAGGAPAPVGAYKPAGAASYAASLVNLANPGTYDLTEGNGAVGWDASYGWQFVQAESKYFITGITPGNDQSWSALVQFSSVLTTTGRLFGYRGGAGREFIILPDDGSGGVIYGNGGRLTIATAMAGGNLAIAGATAYRNGIAEAGSMTAWTGAAGSMFIGCYANGASPTSFISARIQAIVFYSAVLTPEQVVAVAAGMA